MKGRSGFGRFAIVEGLLLILLGGYTFARPDQALTAFIVLYGIMAVLMGIADILLYIRIERYVGFGPFISLISGTLSVMAGAVLLFNPNAGKIILTVLFPLWFLAHCVSRLSNLTAIRLFTGNFNYYFSLVLNLAGLILGMLMLINPWLSWASIRYIIGFYLVLLGIDCIALAISQIGSGR